MGEIMKEDDILIPSQLELLNLRFAPDVERKVLGNISEMVALQKEFEIFKVGRSFRDSAALLTLGGLHNSRVKTRWYKLLDAVGKAPSNVEGQNGSEAIVAALIKDLGSPRPTPVHFTAHDARIDPRVVIDEGQRPIFYMSNNYVKISLPMTPKRGRGGSRRPSAARG